MKPRLGDFTKHLPPPLVLIGAALYLLLVAVVFEAVWGDGSRVGRALAGILAALMVGIPTFALWSKHQDRSYIRDLREQAEPKPTAPVYPAPNLRD